MNSRTNDHAAGGPLPGFHDGPEPQTEARTTLVVGWDTHPPSTAALRYSVSLAHRLTAHIHIVHTADVDDMPIDPDRADWERQMNESLVDEESQVRQLLDGLPASWTYHGGHGDPADLLARVADEYAALMVVIGSPRGGLLSLLDTVLGQSVAHRMIGQRRTPLLIVPADTLVSDEGQRQYEGQRQ